MKKTFLFDLDGTLLPLDMDEFMKVYFDAISKVFHTLGFDLKPTFDAFLAGTMAMVNNDGSQTNEQAFWNTFDQLVDHKHTKLSELLENYYQNEFQEIIKVTEKIEGLNDIMVKLKESGHQLIIATNPLFPEIASVSRVKWAGLDKELFDEITTYENYSHCKPNVNYYQEIIDKFNLDTDNTLMIGNDAQEDLAAGELGIETYLVTDHLIDRSGGNYQANHSGTMADCLKFLQQYISVQ